MAVALGQDLSVLLAEDGTLHLCGRNAYGQLGLNMQHNSFAYGLQSARVGGAELAGGARVVFVAAGEFY